MNRDEFYEQAMLPHTPDALSIQLESTSQDIDRTFSAEGFDDIANQFHDFVMARTFARYQHTGQGPKRLRVDITVRWDEWEDTDDIEYPWYMAVDSLGEALTRIDGQTRISRMPRN